MSFIFTKSASFCDILCKRSETRDWKQDNPYEQRAARAPRWCRAPRAVEKRKSLRGDGLQSVKGPQKARGAQGSRILEVRN